MTGVLADERMSDVDALLWNLDAHSRHRTTIAALARFDAPLDAADLRHRVDRASRVIPRLRQRVIPDPLPIVAPRWSVDPDFRLSYHLRTLHLANGDDAHLTETVRDLIMQPFDRDRPLWEFTHLTGLVGGGDGLLMKAHHAVSDGVGSVDLMLELFDVDGGPAPARSPLPPAPRPPGRAPNPASTVRREVASLLGEVCTALGRLTTPRSLPETTAASRALGEAIGSATRMLRPAATEPVVPSARSDGLDLRFFSLPLEALRTAGRDADGTVNDAFVSGIVLGVARHFGRRTHRSDAPPLRVGVPINTRNADAGVGNHWAPSRIDVDLGRTTDPTVLMRDVRRTMRHARVDPAHRLLDPLAAGLSRFPAAASATVFASVGAALDIAASNVPGSPVTLHLCGQEVRTMIPFGPLSGCAVNTTLLSHADTAHIGVSTDPAAVDDPDRLIDDFRGAFATITGAKR